MRKFRNSTQKNLPKGKMTVNGVYEKVPRIGVDRNGKRITPIPPPPK